MAIRWAYNLANYSGLRTRRFWSLCRRLRGRKAEPAAILTACLLAAQPGFAQTEIYPIISNLRVSPVIGYRGTLITFKLFVQDPKGADQIENELYIVREGVETMSIEIYDDGTRGDRAAGDGEYMGRLNVPPNAEIRTHVFHVYVKNRAGYRSNTLFYEFTVLSRGESI